MATSTRERAADVALRLIPAEHHRARWSDLAELGFAVIGFLAYFLVRGAVVTRAADALDHARDIVRLEIDLGLFIEPQIQHWVLSSPVFWGIANFVYFWCDFPLIVAVGLLLFWRRRDQYTKLRDSLLLSGAFALLIYMTFPVAPPRFLAEWGFVDTLEVFSNLSYQAQSLHPFVNQYAAVPSLHVGWSVLLAVAVFRSTPHWYWRGGMLLVLAVQLVAVIGTGNHFIFDGLVGIAVCLAALEITDAMHRSSYPAVRRRIHRWSHVGR
ncbi:MAG: inositol phosphorylceramide synthase [Chloroflexi bacterium]|nr:MAG: inositol phosphorylceramide synthase [Chloroflexota bacterium]